MNVYPSRTLDVRTGRKRGSGGSSPMTGIGSPLVVARFWVCFRACCLCRARTSSAHFSAPKEGAKECRDPRLTPWQQWRAPGARGRQALGPPVAGRGTALLVILAETAAIGEYCISCTTFSHACDGSRRPVPSTPYGGACVQLSTGSAVAGLWGDGRGDARNCRVVVLPSARLLLSIYHRSSFQPNASA